MHAFPATATVLSQCGRGDSRLFLFVAAQQPPKNCLLRVVSDSEEPDGLIYAGRYYRGTLTLSQDPVSISSYPWPLRRAEVLLVRTIPLS